MFNYNTTVLLVDKATWEREFATWEVPMHKLPIWAEENYIPPTTEKEIKDLIQSYMTTATTFVDKEIVYFNPPTRPEDEKEANFVATFLIYFSDFLPNNTYFYQV